MKDGETWDDRYNLINHPYLHYGVIAVNAAFAAGEDSGDSVILATGAITITLPPANENRGKAFYIKNVGAAGATTIAPSVGDLIDGAVSQSLPDQYDAMLVVSDGVTDWWILSFSNL
jgi:hypothetical protein